MKVTGEVIFADENIKPTGETPLHTHVYKKRPDIKALVHAHPPVITGYAIAHSDLLSKPVLPEPILELGPVLSIRYEEPLTYRLAYAIEEVIDRTNAFLMNNHGIMILSYEGPERAVELLEMLEAMAKSILVANQLGNMECIPENELANLDNVCGTRGLPYPGKPGMFSSFVDIYR